MTVEIRLRRDTAANWTSVDPTLGLGEVGIETDTRRFKVGDGSTAWTGLVYYGVATDVLWDAKGDLVVGTGANTAGKLAVGSDDQIFRVATDTPAWESPSIADKGILRVDQADAADNDYAKFTANGLEGRSYSEVLSDIGAAASNPLATDSLWDAKGDLVVGSGSNTAGRLAVGTDDYVLRVASDTPAWEAEFDATVPANQTYGDSAATGSATVAARRDHKHGMPAIYSHPNHSGAVTSTGDGATAIADKAVTLAKMNDITTNSILGRVSASTGVPEVLSATNVRTIINVADGATAVTVENTPTSGHTTQAASSNSVYLVKTTADAAMPTASDAAAAVTAMGAKGNSNPLNHDRYTDAEAINAAHTIHLNRLQDPDGPVAFAGHEATNFVVQNVPDQSAMDGVTQVAGKLLYRADQSRLYVCATT